MLSKEVRKEIEVRAMLQYGGKAIFLNLEECGYSSQGKQCQRKWNGKSALAFCFPGTDIVHIFLPCSVHAKKLKDVGWEEV